MTDISHFPKPNTQVRIKRMHNFHSDIQPGDIMYVTAYQGAPSSSVPNAIPVSKFKDDSWGSWAAEWELVDVDAETILTRLTPAEKQALTDGALKAAKARGLCGDTARILGDLGLPTTETKKTWTETITIEVEVEHAAHSNGKVHPFNITMDYSNSHVGTMTVKKVTQADGTERFAR